MEDGNENDKDKNYVNAHDEENGDVFSLPG